MKISKFRFDLGAPRSFVALGILIGAFVHSSYAQNNLPNIDFNTNNWSSDTTGSLLGTVLFAQNQIIPSVAHIANDVQPHLTAERNTLVMFKVNPNLVSPTNKISVKAYSGSGQLLGNFTMAQPQDIPKQPKYLVGVNLSSLVFNTAPVNGFTITNADDLAKLGDPSATYLKGLLAKYKDIIINMYDGFWIPKIYLPEGSFLGKNVLIKSNAGYSSEVSYKGQRFANSAPINRGTVLPFTFNSGLWISPADVEQTRFVYGHNFWTATLPASWIKPGLNLAFESGRLKGTLLKIKVGAPSELILHTIDIGMLTPPRNAFSFANEPATGAHYEYFQTIPVSRMVVSKYEPLYLKEVMMPDGRLLTKMDPSAGGWHEGDMREAIGKHLISQGINNANYGIWSTSSSDENSHPFTVAQLTAHNSVGKYSNGIQIHGGSGGAGIVTLDASLGNEFSHEVGHNFGLGHYMGGAKGSMQRPANDVNSTWGWDSRKNVFIPNFYAIKTNQPSCWTIDNSSKECIPPFQGFSFGWDAMAGGEPMYPQINRFTLYSPYSMKYIQDFFESRAVFAKDSPTGFRKWNAQTCQMDPFEMRVSVFEEVNATPNDATDARYFSRQFERGAKLISVKMYDGFWGQSIVIPLASSANSGRFIEIEHHASYHSTLNLNGNAVEISNGTHKIYQSNGKTWQETSQIIRTVAKKPQQFGIPVTTLVGYYDPEGTIPSYIYPALYGGYGFTYSDDISTLNANECYLMVKTNAGFRRFRLRNFRVDSGQMNKFHVNIPQTEAPSVAYVVCSGKVLVSKVLDGPKSNPSYTVNGVALPK